MLLRLMTRFSAPTVILAVVIPRAGGNTIDVLFSWTLLIPLVSATI